MPKSSRARFSKSWRWTTTYHFIIIETFHFQLMHLLGKFCYTLVFYFSPKFLVAIFSISIGDPVDSSELRQTHQLRLFCISHYLQGFIHPTGGWDFGISGFLNHQLVSLQWCPMRLEVLGRRSGRRLLCQATRDGWTTYRNRGVRGDVGTHFLP